MADFESSTPGVLAKDVTVFRHTPVTAQFSRLLGDLAVLVEAERDIEQVDLWDVAFADWLGDAERAHHTVTTRLTTLLDCPAARPEDRKLHSAGLILHSLVSSEEPGGFRRMFAAIRRHSWPFACSGGSAFQRRVDLMLKTMLARIEDLGTLDCYRDEHFAEFAAGDQAETDDFTAVAAA